MAFTQQKRLPPLHASLSGRPILGRADGGFGMPRSLVEKVFPLSCPRPSTIRRDLALLKVHRPHRSTRDGFSLLHHDGLMAAGHVLAFFEGTSTAHRFYSGVTVTPSTPLPAGPKFFSPAHALGSSRRSPPCRDCIDCLGERGIFYHSPVRTDHTRSLVILTLLFSAFKKHRLYTITQRKPLP